MTNEEAIERLKKRICQEGVHREDKTYHFCTDGCMYGEEECEIAIAIKAIKKQIPKKPNIERQDACFAFWCPGCNNLLINKYNNEFIVGEKEEFCEECGQRIDWSEEK